MKNGSNILKTTFYHCSNDRISHSIYITLYFYRPCGIQLVKYRSYLKQVVNKDGGSFL